MPLISISDVIDATNDGTRCLIEGERVLDGKMLISVGSLGLSDNQVLKVWALCLQSSYLTGAPHVLEVSLNLRTIYKRIVKISCSCKAGQSQKCKHCIALLMYLNRIDDASDLEDLSCTDLTQQWGKLKKAALSEFEAIPLTDFCHFVAPLPIYAKGVPEVSKELAHDFATFIIQGAPKSESFLHSTGVRASASQKNCVPDSVAQEVQAKRLAAGSLTQQLLQKEKGPCFQELVQMTKEKEESLSPELLDFYEKNVKLDTRASVGLSSNTALQCELEWENARKYRITGTKAYQLSTYTRNKKANWPEKIRKTFYGSFNATPAMMHGLEQEPKARMAYSRETGKKVIENGIFVHPDLPWLGTSVDGVAVEEVVMLEDQVAGVEVEKVEEPSIVIEIKSLILGKTKTASVLPKYAECCDQNKKLKKKHKYHGQVQFAMFLTGLKECDFLLYASLDDTYAPQTIPYDDKFVFEMLSPLVNVYFDKILPYHYEKNVEPVDPVDPNDVNEDEEELE